MQAPHTDKIRRANWRLDRLGQGRHSPCCSCYRYISVSAPFRANGDVEASAEQEAHYVCQARTIATPYVARLRGLMVLSDRSVSDLLDRGWRDWKKQAASAAR